MLDDKIRPLLELVGLPEQLVNFVVTCHDYKSNYTNNPLRDAAQLFTSTDELESLGFKAPPEDQWEDQRQEYLELAKDIPRLRAHNMTAWAGRRKAGAEKIEQFKKLVESSIGTTLADSDIDDLMNMYNQADAEQLSTRLDLAVKTVGTLAGTLRWTLGLAMGFLNYTNTGGRRLGAQEVSQEVGWASKTYSGQNKQSFLAWSFFSCPYQSSAWSKGQGIPPINFLVGYGTELNGLFSHRAEALNHAFHDAIKEHKISEREAGRLIRHYPYEWLLFLRPDTTEDEEDAEAQRSINLMQSIIQKFQQRLPFDVRGPISHLWTMIGRALDPAYRGPIQATEKFTPEQCSILEELHLQGHPSPSVLNDLFPEIPMHALVKFKKDVMGVTTTKPEILPRPSAGTTAAEDTARLDGQDHRSPVSTSSSPSPGRAPPSEPAPSSPQALPASLLPLPPAYKLQQEKEKACEDPPASRSPSPENTADAKAHELFTLAKQIKPNYTKTPLPPGALGPGYKRQNYRLEQPTASGHCPCCGDDLTAVASANRPKKVHACYLDSLKVRYTDAFAQIWESTDGTCPCPMAQCPRSFPSARAMAAHITVDHTSTTCRRDVGGGVPCGEVYDTFGELKAHLELDHGLLRFEGGKSHQVRYCECCEDYAVGLPAIRMHAAKHISDTLALMSVDPTCLGYQGALVQLFLCPLCIVDAELPPEKQFNTHSSADTRNKHMCSEILTLHPHTPVECPFGTCSGETFAPAELCDHIIVKHEIKIAGGTGKNKKKINGDFSKLSMAPDTRKKFDRSDFRITPAHCATTRPGSDESDAPSDHQPSQTAIQRGQSLGRGRARGGRGSAAASSSRGSSSATPTAGRGRGRPRGSGRGRQGGRARGSRSGGV